MTAAGNCFHCGAVLDRGQPVMVMLDGQQRQCCGEDCARVVRRISDRGLSGFYRFRDGPTAAAADRDTSADRWSGFDRPALQREFVSTEADGSRRAQLLLQGVRCAACSWLIENALTAVPGVRGITVDAVSARASLHWDPARIRLSELLAQLAQLGYTPYPYTEDASDRAAVSERRSALQRLILAGLGAMQVMSFAVAMYAGAWRDAEIQEFLRLVSLVVATPVVFYSGAPFFNGAWRGLRAGALGMDVPVALAIGGAWTASVWHTFTGSGEVYFDSATMFVFFLSAARFLEMSGRHRALSLTGSLARHLPRIATRLVDGNAQEVGTMELEAGDLVLVQPGGTVPADGDLDSASARLDESLLSGESTPVRRLRGERLVAGSINLEQALRLRVTGIGADTVLAQITQLVGDAQADKPRLVQIADRIASYFIAAVLVAAAAVGLLWWLIAPERAFEVVLAVLVVTCPCALALATPAVFTVATAALARRGFMVRRAGALQLLSQVTDVVFDKTGTLTGHDAGIERIVVFGQLDQAEALATAAALEAQSEHPLARAFPRAQMTAEVTAVRAVPGAGLEGELDAQPWRIGTRQFALALSGQTPPVQDQPDESARVVYLGSSQGLVARFDIAESLRPGTTAALAALRRAGLSLLVASGDREGPVRLLADRLGIEQWHAGMQPSDKLDLVRSLQRDGHRVAMLGDGINDSPVLAGADVSIAMGSGTSLAQHSADCVLTSTSLQPLADALSTSRKAMRVVRQNLAWAVGYNLVALPLAATGLLAPWMAALGMSASSLLVTMNALRLGRPPAGIGPGQQPADAGAQEPSLAAQAPCCKTAAGAASG